MNKIALIKKNWLFSVGLFIIGIVLFAGCIDESQNNNTSETLGKVTVYHNLASEEQDTSRLVTIGHEATDFTFTGLGSDGETLYGPETRSRADKHDLEGVSEDVKRIKVEYRTQGGELHAEAQTPVNVSPGRRVTVNALASKDLTVLLVNESEVDDENVYVLLSANGDVTVDTDVKGNGVQGELAIYEIGTGSEDVVSKKMTELQVVTTLKSPVTGKTNKVYGFEPLAVDSGRLWISYNQPLTYKKGDNAPTNLEKVRYDKMEIGYTAGENDDIGYFDLTSVDFFGIPMQLEVMADKDDLFPFRTTTFYTSTTTLLKTLYNLDPTIMDKAFYKISDSSAVSGWTPGADNLKDFLRVMSPLSLAAMVPKKGSDFSAAPYPSFRNYLTSLVNSGVAVSFKGANGVDGGQRTKWSYQASIASDGKDGFLVTCKPTGAMVNIPMGSMGDKNYPDQALPSDLTVTMPLTKKYLDQFVYGIPANSFSVKDLGCHLTPYAANSVYANVAGNFLAALSFGYVEGRYGENGANWFDVLPGYAPYGAARKAQDGYYNPYAAVLYNLSDSYSFSISDRLKVGNPLLTTSPDKPYLRITILPDARLNAPQNVRITGVSKDSLTIEWDPVSVDPASGFTLTGYKIVAADGSVEVVNPDQKLPSKITPNQIVVNATSIENSAKLTGLKPGTCYKVSVMATGLSDMNEKVRSTPGMFTTAVTDSGSPTKINESINYVLGVSPSSDLNSDISYSVDGNTVSRSASLAVKKPKPSVNGTLVQNLFRITGPNQDIEKRKTDPTVTYAQTNILFNAVDSGDNTFKPYFNFPISSTVPKSGTDHAKLMDGSKISFGYSPTYGSDKIAQPPFGDNANSLVLNVIPEPTNVPKTYSKVKFPSSTPVVLNPNPPAPPEPGYNPPENNPVSCTVFKVQAVLEDHSSLDISDLKGSTVKIKRLVSVPSDITGIPAADGSGADAAGTLNNEGWAEFDPSKSPYNAPIWNMGYCIEITYKNANYKAYGAWTKAKGEVGAKWKSGLISKQDKPGVIYVPIYNASGEQDVWGN